MGESYTLNDVKLEIAGNMIGGAQSVEVKLEQDNGPLHGNGTKKPIEIKRGQMTYSGSIERLYLDVDYLKSTIDFKNGDNPYIDIVGVVKNKNSPQKVVVRDAVFKGVTLSMALNEATKHTQEFDALDMEFLWR